MISMNALRTAAIALPLSATALTAQEPERLVGAGSELFTNLSLIDGRGGPPQDNASILVWNGRIQAVGPRSSLQVPQGTQVVDLEGAFVIPGLIDAYAAPRDSTTLAGMLAVGVTGVREAAMPLDRFERLGRNGFGDGPRPDVFIGGPTIDGRVGGTGIPVESPDRIDDIVDRLADDGARFLSLSESVEPSWVRDFARAARRNDVSVWVERRADGWLLSARYGADVMSGIVSLDPEMLPEAARDAFRSSPARGMPAAVPAWLGAVDPEGPELDLAISALLSSDAAVVPLLAATGVWDDGLENRSVALDLVASLHREGIRLLVGSGFPSDSGSGERFHRELALLVDAGIEPIDVLSMATRNGAIALGELHRRGTIEGGKRADFVVLGGDPTANIANAADVRMVVLRGRAWAPGPRGFERVRFR